MASLAHWYVFIHTTYQLLRFTSPPMAMHVIAVQLPLVIAQVLSVSVWTRASVSLFSTRTWLGINAFVNALIVMYHLPAVVDMDWWMMQVDLMLVVALLVFPKDAEEEMSLFVAELARVQLGIFYFASGFWKVNENHNDPRLSCSSLMLVQILVGWLPKVMLPRPLLVFVLHVSPHITTTVEIGIAVLLLIGSCSAPSTSGVKGDSSANGVRESGVAGAAPCRVSRGFFSFGVRVFFLYSGLILAVLLHIGIMIAPFPNSVGDFGAMCVSRLLLTLPGPMSSMYSTLTSTSNNNQNGGDKIWVRLRLVVVAVCVIAISCLTCVVHKSFERILANVTFTGLSAVMIEAILYSYQNPSCMRNKESRSRIRNLGVYSLETFFVFLAAFYAIGMPLFGLIDVGGCIMFSHLKLHGGSNHLLLPAGLLQEWFANKSPMDASLGQFADFAGGIVRIEFSSSTFLNSNYPGEVDKIQPEPEFRKLLHNMGHIARMFRHPGVRRKNMRGKTHDIVGGLTAFGLGAFVESFPNEVSFNHQFIRYTLPALELRMMLIDIRDRNESFTIEYTRLTERPKHLKSLEALEQWRAEGCGKRVYYSEQYREGRRTFQCYTINTCTTTSLPSFWPQSPGSLANVYTRSQCSDDEIVLLTKHPSLLGSTFVLSNPYPILDIPGRACGSSG